MYILIFIGIFIISAVICHFIARSRGANAVYWGVMGAVFGPLAIPFAFISKNTGTSKN
ncbi:MAG: hypothetical protein QNL62_23300 [Gammaproteobacteria bacterium]|nr:hypothetical protein [Gammaproteobacteria bacterium]